MSKSSDSPVSPLFVGKRLADARVARGFTMTQLANFTGIKKQSISNYENGKQTPKADALAALTDRLGISLAFLQKDAPTASTAPIFFRSLAGLAKREWAKAEVQLAWFEEIYTYLDEHINFVPPNIPRHFDISTRLNKVTRDEIEEIAYAVRSYWELGLGPISNMTRLLENNGVLIVRMPLDVKEEDAFSQWQRDNTVPVIVSVAESPSACRDRFSLAHELGHLVLHSKVTLKQETLSVIEAQANQFASAFLLPAASYLREFRYPSLEILKVLKEKWKASIKSQVYRCKELRVITEQSSRNFYLNMAKRKWIRSEPLDDVIPPERPKVIKESLALLELNANITLDDIARETTISPIDIAMLFGIERKEEKQEQALPTIKSSARVLQFRKAGTEKFNG
ncbi:MAG: hypothetical protein DELT_00821 [Desulfovibrio sp.]